MKQHPCPWCGRLIHDQGKRHTQSCIGNPAVFAATRAALDDGAGRIKPKEQYLAEGAPPGAASATTLFMTIGSWRQVAERFGLNYAGYVRRPRLDKPRRSQIDWESVVTAMAAELDAAAELAATNRFVGEGLTVCNVRIEGSRIHYMLR